MYVGNFARKQVRYLNHFTDWIYRFEPNISVNFVLALFEKAYARIEFYNVEEGLGEKGALTVHCCKTELDGLFV